MTDAVIVSTARTSIGRAYKGALNNTEGATLLGHAISSAVSRAKLDGAEVEDVVMGCAMQQGTTASNIARRALVRAGLPVMTAGTTIDRQCASGLQAIALAARSVIFDGVEVAVGGGGEFDQPRSERQDEHVPRGRSRAARDERRHLYVDAGYRGSGGEALQYLPRAPGRVWSGEPAPHRFRPAGRTLQRRARAHHRDDGGHGQGKRRNFFPEGDAVGRRGDSAGHDGRRACPDQAGQGAGLHHHRGQREFSFRTERARPS